METQTQQTREERKYTLSEVRTMLDYTCQAFDKLNSAHEDRKMHCTVTEEGYRLTCEARDFLKNVPREVMPAKLERIFGNIGGNYKP